jgi:hypothetical protein
VSAPLQAGVKAIDPMAFGLNWFGVLAESKRHIAAKRWATGMPLPYRWITVVSNPRRGYVSYPLIRVHVIAATFGEASQEGIRNDDRAQVLVDYPGWAANCLWAEIVESAREEPYPAESVVTRFVSEYRFAFSLVAA